MSQIVALGALGYATYAYDSKMKNTKVPVKNIFKEFTQQPRDLVKSSKNAVSPSLIVCQGSAEFLIFLIS